MNRKLQDMLYTENKEATAEEKAGRERKRAKEGEAEDFAITRLWSSGESSIKNIDLRKYFDELKHRRNKEIDQIENILK